MPSRFAYLPEVHGQSVWVGIRAPRGGSVSVDGVRGRVPDCEVVAVAWPDSAQLTVGTWLAPGCGPVAVVGPAAPRTRPRAGN